MEKERSTKIIAIIALVVAIVGLSVGFATYTEQLQISDTSATVGAGSADDFSVEFSTSNTEIERTFSNLITNATENGATATQGTTPSITSTTVSGLSANFTAPGQSVAYTLYAHNTGKFLAYLKNITIGEKTCEANEGTNQSLVDLVCPSITMTVEVEGEEATKISVSDITNHSLAIGSNDTIKITMTYDGDASYAADGDFKVNFGQVTLDYNYVD